MRRSDAAIVVFDISSKTSFDGLNYWVQ